MQPDFERCPARPAADDGTEIMSRASFNFSSATLSHARATVGPYRRLAEFLGTETESEGIKMSVHEVNVDGVDFTREDSRQEQRDWLALTQLIVAAILGGISVFIAYAAKRISWLRRI